MFTMQVSKHFFGEAVLTATKLVDRMPLNPKISNSLILILKSDNLPHHPNKYLVSLLSFTNA